MLFGIWLMLSLSDNMRPYFYGNEVAASKIVHLDNAVKKPNLIFFGSSRTYHHINPMLFDSLCSGRGVTSFNAGSRATFNPESYYLVESFLNSDLTKGVDNLIVEIQDLSDIDPKNSRTVRGYYWTNLSYLSYSIGFVRSSNLGVLQKTKLITKYSLSWLYKQFDVSRLRTLIFPLEHQQVKFAGFEPFFSQDIEDLGLKELLKYENAAAAFCKKNNFDQNTSHVKKLLHLQSVAAAKNIELLFFIPPRCDNYDFASAVMESELSDYVIILSCPSDFPEFYEYKNLYDRAHLNIDGATLFTTELAKAYVKKNEK
jgi:hypothetical protein